MFFTAPEINQATLTDLIRAESMAHVGSANLEAMAPPLPTGSGYTVYTPSTATGSLAIVPITERQHSLIIEIEKLLKDFSSLTSNIVSDQVANIKATLNLSIKDLATILGVQRPTVYAWMSGEQIPHGANLERIEEIAQLAVRLKKPLDRKAAKVPLNGKSLLNLLDQESIDHDAVQKHLDQLLNTRTKPQGVFAKMVAREGRQLSMPDDVQDRVDALTGKPAS